MLLTVNAYKNVQVLQVTTTYRSCTQIHKYSQRNLILQITADLSSVSTQLYHFFKEKKSLLVSRKNARIMLNAFASLNARKNASIMYKSLAILENLKSSSNMAFPYQDL